MGTRAPVQVLTVILGDQSYGVDILRVQEIRGWTQVTRVPYTPSHVLGVLNMRGSIIPVIDLRRLFALERVEYSATTVIVVLSMVCGDLRRYFGAVVDGVSDVVDVDPAHVRAAPDLGSSAATHHVRGLLPIGERMVILLDTDKLVGPELMQPAPAAHPELAAA